MNIIQLEILVVGIVSDDYGIAYCPREFPDEEVAKNCKRYKAGVVHGDVYANPHCALCHGVGEYFCGSGRIDLPPVRKGETVPISILFDFSSGKLSVESPRENGNQ